MLGSIANYVHQTGWQSGLPWGFEVVVPRGFDYAASRGSFQQWRERGLQRADGNAFPDAGDAILFFPSGAPARPFW